MESEIDSKSIASEFASKVRKIFNNQTGIRGQGAQITENVQDGHDTKKAGDVKNLQNAKNARDVKKDEVDKNKHDILKTSIVNTSTGR
jgi:hypothetical protein